MRHCQGQANPVQATELLVTAPSAQKPLPTMNQLTAVGSSDSNNP